MIMAAKFTRMTHKIAIKLYLVAKSCTICRARLEGKTSLFFC